MPISFNHPVIQRNLVCSSDGLQPNPKTSPAHRQHKPACSQTPSASATLKDLWALVLPLLPVRLGSCATSFISAHEHHASTSKTILPARKQPATASRLEPYRTDGGHHHWSAGGG